MSRLRLNEHLVATRLARLLFLLVIDFPIAVVVVALPLTLPSTTLHATMRHCHYPHIMSQPLTCLPGWEAI